MTDNIIDVRGASVRFPIMSRGVVRQQVDEFVAVDNVSFTVERGSALGIVGESGSGKTTLVRSLLGAVKPSAGEAYFYPDSGGAPLNLFTLNQSERYDMYRQMQMIFQDPFASLNPRMKVGDIIAEPLVIHEPGQKQHHRYRVVSLLEKVGLDASAANRFPHAFSGGQRQRIGIARALILSPPVVICDEAVSALDVSVQAQILQLLKSLQEELQLTYLFVTHDLKVMQEFCDQAIVMYRGNLVESGSVDGLFSDPQHDYTRLLLSAIPSLDPDEPLSPLDRSTLKLD